MAAMIADHTGRPYSEVRRLDADCQLDDFVYVVFKRLHDAIEAEQVELARINEELGVTYLDLAEAQAARRLYRIGQRSRSGGRPTSSTPGFLLGKVIADQEKFDAIANSLKDVPYH